MAAGIHRQTKCLKVRPPVVQELFFLCKRVWYFELCYFNISASHVQYGMQAFANFKRPEYTRLLFRELQSQKFLLRGMHPKLPRKVRRSQFWWVLTRPYCHWGYLHAPSVTKSSLSPWQRWAQSRKEANICSLPKVYTPVFAEDFIGGIRLTLLIARAFETIVYGIFYKEDI